jgi:two-component system phosphate regulon sensor histidine kinase PhoR
MHGRRLFWQIFSAYLGITVVLILLLGLSALYEVHNLYLDEKAAELEAGARACQARIGDLTESGTSAGLQDVCRRLGETLGMRVTVILPLGRVVADSSENPESMENHSDRPEIQQALDGSVGRSARYSTTLREEMMYVAIPVEQAGAVAAVIRTSFAVRTLGETLHAMYWRIAAGGLIAVLLVAGASLAVARRIARPLEAIRSGAERFARGQLRHRLPVSGAEEVRMLAQSMNRMAEQLDQRIQTIVNQENERQAMLASMEEGLLAVDEGATILNLNDTCGALLGVDPEKARGRLVHEVIRKSALLSFVERTLATATPVEEDFELRGQVSRWLHAHGTVLHDARMRKIGALVVLHDVTRLRHLENVRRDFVANVSHELRTPITSIKGFVETMLHENLEDRDTAIRFLQIVLRQVNRLDEILQDLLMLSRVERGAEEHTIELEPAPLAEVLRSAVEMCEKKAADKQITVEVRCPEELTARINAPLLEQAVVNLIDNAVKYSESQATVRVIGAGQAHEVVIRVEDDGCGIEARHLPRLFERFYRVDRARSRELGGTGLGLAIVKHIVAAHKGSVRVESTVGRGSTFFIHLPPI